jgi:hypothetical protein
MHPNKRPVTTEIARLKARTVQFRVTRSGWQDRDNSTHEPEQQAFDQQLACEHQPARAERRPDCHFAFAGRPSGQQQAGDVGARNHQYESDCTEQHGEQRLSVFEEGLPNRLEPECIPLVVWVFAPQPIGQLAHTLLRLGHGETLPHSADDRISAAPARGHLGRVEDQRDVNFFASDIGKALREDANHRASHSVHDDGLPDNAGIS